MIEQDLAGSRCVGIWVLDLSHEFSTSERFFNERKGGRANCEMRVVVSPKITRAGVDNSATWFVNGMIHRQIRRKWHGGELVRMLMLHVSIQELWNHAKLYLNLFIELKQTDC